MGSSTFSPFPFLSFVRVAVGLAVAWLGAGVGFAADSSLAIVGAGVQVTEDAPFVSATHEFLPGDYLYFTFQIAGFQIKSEQRDQVRKIALKYSVTIEDANSTLLAPQSAGEIGTELSPQDKDWIPKRRASFLLPPYVSAGDYRVHVAASDSLSGAKAAADFPFRVGGTHVSKSAGLSVQDFQFTRREDDEDKLDVAAYSPGDTVYAQFNIVGFHVGGPENRHHLSYGVTVRRPDGKPFLKEEKAAELDAGSFYPAQYLPGTINVLTSPDSQHGQYVMIITVHDLLGNTASQVKEAFSIE